MTAGIVYPAQPRRMATCITALSALALGTSLAIAQAPQPAPQVPAPKATPRPVAPMQQRYIVCLRNGCMADFDVNVDFVGKLKKGQQLVLQGINLPGQAATYMLPLADFAKANEGPPTDPKKFEEDQKKLQEELQKKAEEARKRLQASPPEGQKK